MTVQHNILFTFPASNWITASVCIRSTLKFLSVRSIFHNSPHCGWLCLIFNQDKTLFNQVKFALRATYDVKLYGGDFKIFLRWNITRSPHGIQVTQSPYAKQILEKFGLENSNNVQTPFPRNANLTPWDENEPRLSLTQHNAYRSIIGSISYLETLTRPDLSFPISSLSRYLHAPCQRQMALANRALWYISGTLSYDLHFPLSGANDEKLMCYLLFRLGQLFGRSTFHKGYFSPNQRITSLFAFKATNGYCSCICWNWVCCFISLHERSFLDEGVLYWDTSQTALEEVVLP